MNLNNIDYFYCSFDEGTGKTNKDFFAERKYLGGWTVSDRHPIIGLKRHASKEILPQDKIVNISHADLRIILEETLKKYATDKNVIFLSGGKDSSALAHAFKQLDIPFEPVSLYSNLSSTTEVNVVKQLEKELDIKVNFYHLDIIPIVDFPYWVENPYTAKAMAVRDLGLTDYNLFTGEIGTGEMQVNQSLQYTAQLGYKPRQLARWHVNVCGSYRRINSTEYIHDNPIYFECIEHFENRFAEWDRHPDVLNRVMFSRLQDEGAYRLFNYGLDNLNWVHPFAESEWISACTNMPSVHKGKKNLYREMYPEMTDLAWRYPKSGLGIPTV